MVYHPLASHASILIYDPTKPLYPLDEGELVMSFKSVTGWYAPIKEEEGEKGSGELGA